MMPYQLLFSHTQPRPRFCVYRPGGFFTPLIPLDELPAWLVVCVTPDMLCGMQAVSPNFIPREGEYDVICHHCSSSVDSQHQSVSERNADSQSQTPPSSTEQTRTCPPAFFTTMPRHDFNTDPKDSLVLPPPAIPLVSVIQNPLVGLKMVDMVGKGAHVRSASFGFQKPLKLSDSSPSSSEESVPAQPETERSPQASQDRADTPATSVDGDDNQMADDEASEKRDKTKRDLMRSLFEEENCTGKRPDSPYPFASSDGSPTSIASTISLAQAVEFLRAKNNGAATSKKAPFKAKNTFNPSAYTNSKPKPRRVRSKARRNVRFQKRTAKKEKVVTTECTQNPEPSDPAKPEQINSYTQRRDRREAAMQKKHEGKEAANQYWHKMMVPNWGSHGPHR